MSLLIALIMMGSIHLAVCDPSIHVYAENCQPPQGITPKPNANTTTPAGAGPVYKDPIQPLERCCPACEECVHIGGRCKIRWLPEMYPQLCDFQTIPECKDYSCTCCIKCADDKCSPCIETGGECRVECRAGEIEDLNNKCSFHPPFITGPGKSRQIEYAEDGKSRQIEYVEERCKCCKQCEATSECIDAYGKCVTDPDDCPAGSFASTGCCGGCYCCKPVLEGVPSPDGGPSECSKDGSYCSETAECASGFYSCFGQCQKTLWHLGLQSIELGYCCVPKQAGSPGSRRSAALPSVLNQLMGIEAHPAYGRLHNQI